MLPLFLLSPFPLPGFVPPRIYSGAYARIRMNISNPLQADEWAPE